MVSGLSHVHLHVLHLLLRGIVLNFFPESKHLLISTITQVCLTSNLDENRASTDRLRRYADEVANNRQKLEKLTSSAQSLLEACAPSDGNMSRQVG